MLWILGASELLAILKYFLCPPKDAYSSVVNVRKEWEKQALSAIEKASDKESHREESVLGKGCFNFAYDGARRVCTTCWPHQMLMQ
jgi:hypothetical protein